jgi:Flp pilus assembly pilin Flp
MATLIAVVVIGSVTALGVAVQGLFTFPVGL